MFKFIGGAVVCGLALYGLMKYLERPVLKVLINPEKAGKPEQPFPESAGGDGAPLPSDVASPEIADVETAAGVA